MKSPRAHTHTHKHKTTKAVALVFDRISSLETYAYVIEKLIVFGKMWNYIADQQNSKQGQHGKIVLVGYVKTHKCYSTWCTWEFRLRRVNKTDLLFQAMPVISQHVKSILL